MKQKIKWVNNKKIDINNINIILETSINQNHFTNNGPVLLELEIKLRSLLQIEDNKSVFCVSNGTVALWAAIAALQLKLDKKLRLVTQSFTFPPSAQGFLQDVDIVDINSNGGIDLELLDMDSIDGIIVTNVFGHIVNINEYTEWCEKHNKILIFDNAATPYTFYHNKNCVNYGNVSTISLHHTKPIGFGEGGIIVIDKEYHKYVERIINFGIDNNSENPVWHRLGGNYKMSDIAAAFCMQYLENFTIITNHHKKLFDLFWNTIKQYNLDKQIIPFPNFSQNTPFVSCITFFSEKNNEIIQDFLSNDIFTRKYYKPLLNTPIANNFYNKIVCIPCHLDVTENDVINYVQRISTIIF